MSNTSIIAERAVQRSEAGELFTTSEAIAEGTGVQHKNVLELIARNQADLGAFGQVAFETRPGYNNAKVRVAALNERQATLLLTYLRNTDQVKAFKLALVRAFYDMAERLNAPQSEGSVEERALQVMGELQGIVERQREALKEAAPKAEAFDAFINSEGVCSMGTVAKMLGMGRTNFFWWLRDAGILIKEGSMRNTPYQRYAGYFEVKALPYRNRYGEMEYGYTTYVKHKGVEYLRRRLTPVKELAPA